MTLFIFASSLALVFAAITICIWCVVMNAAIVKTTCDNANVHNDYTPI